MSALTIAHSPAEGTVLHGTTRADNVGPVLREQRTTWRWSSAVEAWILTGSRDHLPRRHVIEATAAALRAAGHDVTVEYSYDRRDIAEREAEKTARAGDRAERLTERSARRAEESDGRSAAARAATEHIPMGQPILVGHHSERKHRAALARAERNDRAAWDLDRAAKSDAERARAAEATQRHRHNLPTTLRRVERLEAELRRVERNLVRSPYCTEEQHALGVARLIPVRDGLVEELTYWRAQVAAAETAGAKVWSKADFTKGDGVRMRHGIARVLRVNAKSVTVPHLDRRLADAGYTWKVPYDQVTGHVPAEQLAAAEAALAEAEATESPSAQ